MAFGRTIYRRIISVRVVEQICEGMEQEVLTMLEFMAGMIAGGAIMTFAVIISLRVEAVCEEETDK